MKTIAVIGGAGYIGSHTIVELLAAGHRPVIVDNFITSDRGVLDRLEKLTGKTIAHYEQDYQDSGALKRVLTKEKVDGIIHFAAFKAVGESVADPLKYYHNNVAGFVGMLQTALACGVRDIVLSSSAAVYGNPPTDTVTETTPCAPESPYGWSKRMDEIILADTCAANPSLRGIALRYFNVVGAHPSGQLGELSKTPPQSLLPIMVNAVATGKPLHVYGDNYDTADGTCLRDYIHVVDLARAHVTALAYANQAKAGTFDTFNIGTGIPTSVLELITAFEQINGIKVPYNISDRRAGDIVVSYATVTKAGETLGWHAEKTIEDAVRDAWRWRQNLDK